MLCLPLTGRGAESSTPSASVFLNSSLKKIKGAGGGEASYSLSFSGHTSRGTIRWQGTKFAIISNSLSSWYDGKNLWCYNVMTRETTLSYPSAGDLAEINPLLYLNAGTRFNTVFASKHSAGSKTLILTPKSKKEGVKKVEIDINTTSLYPSRIKVFTLAGENLTLTVTSVKTGKKFSSSAFTYPKKNYPDIKVIDLR